LFFKTLEQGEGVGSTTGESGEHLILVETPDFAGIALEYGIALGNLAVATDNYLVAATH